jgi:hypothetical protein
VESTGRVNSKGSTTNNKVVIYNNESTLKHKEEPETNANNRLEAVEQLPPTIDAFISNTLKKKRRKTNRKEKEYSYTNHDDTNYATRGRR